MDIEVGMGVDNKDMMVEDMGNKDRVEVDIYVDRNVSDEIKVVAFNVKNSSFIRINSFFFVFTIDFLSVQTNKTINSKNRKILHSFNRTHDDSLDKTC